MRFQFKIISEALRGHKGGMPLGVTRLQSRGMTILSSVAVVMVSATAYYLARRYGKAKIAVVEKGWLGGGNIGRNTTIIRSNYMLDGNEPFYELSLQLWEGLEQDLNYNAMVSQRGILNLFHSDAQRDALFVEAMPCY
ncbi:MAG: hypothetical protein CM15mP95_0230 [Alphaproteobacteria bacterium]|nr:MAG: hypothetical protein CM15mP95_0230 [Alphaproteobacteria bacterium]